MLSHVFCGKNPDIRLELGFSKSLLIQKIDGHRTDNRFAKRSAGIELVCGTESFSLQADEFKKRGWTGHDLYESVTLPI